MNNHALLLLLVGLSGALQSAEAETLGQTKCVSTENLSGQASMIKPGSEQTSFSRAYTEARCFIEESERLGVQWLKTEQILHSSAQKADDGHWDEAFQLLKKARFQAETALNQAKYESGAWERRVISKPEAGK